MSFSERKLPDLKHYEIDYKNIDKEYEKVLKLHGYKWKTIISAYLITKPYLMKKMVNYRKAYFHRICEEVKKNLKKEVKSNKDVVVFKNSGSDNLTSDLDLRVVTNTMDRTLEPKALKLFLDIYKFNKWPKNMSIVFWAQVYGAYKREESSNNLFLKSKKKKRLTPPSPSKIIKTALRNKRIMQENEFYFENSKKIFRTIQIQAYLMQIQKMVPLCWMDIRKELLRINCSLDNDKIISNSEIIFKKERELFN